MVLGIVPIPSGPNPHAREGVRLDALDAAMASQKEGHEPSRLIWKRTQECIPDARLRY